MKDYKQFLKELPSKTIVCAVGQFSPPTVAHELLVKTVQRLSEQKNSDSVIFTSPTEVISEDKKHSFLKLMFPKANIQSLGESFFSSKIKQLSEKYKNIIVVAGADQLNEFKKLKECVGVQVISIGDSDPDSNSDKMISYATKGLYENFKTLLPSNIRDIDGKRLMNEMRSDMKLDPIKEQIKLVNSKLREDYFNGKIFNVGDIVEHSGSEFEIVKRGSNHLLLKEESGNLVSKWIKDVNLVAESYTKIEHNGEFRTVSHGPHFSVKIPKLHHSDIEKLEHGDEYEFECADGGEWKMARRGDRLYLLANGSQERRLTSNISVYIPYNKFVNGEDSEDGWKPLDPGLSSYTQMVINKARTNPELLDDREKDILKIAGHNYGGEVTKNLPIQEGVIQPNGTDKIEGTGPESDTGAKQDPVPKGVQKGFLTFYNYNTKDNSATSMTQGSKPLQKEDCNESDVDAEKEIPVFDPREVGHSLVPSEKFNGHHHIRRMKVKHKIGESKDYNVKVRFTTMDGKTGSHDHVIRNANNVSHANNIAMLRHAKQFSGQHKYYETSPSTTTEIKEETLEQKKDREYQLKKFKSQVDASGVVKVLPGDQPAPISGAVTSQKPFDPFFKETLELSDSEIEKLIDLVTEEEIDDLYDEDEITLVYEDTGEEVEHHPEEYKFDLMEVLSRTERMKGKIRLRKTSAKRERSTKIALKRFSAPTQINKRARRLAIKVIKTKMLGGKSPANASVNQKERIEKVISQNRALVDRVAIKMIPKIRAVEKKRMSHNKSQKA